MTLNTIQWIFYYFHINLCMICSHCSQMHLSLSQYKSKWHWSGVDAPLKYINKTATLFSKMSKISEGELYKELQEEKKHQLWCGITVALTLFLYFFSFWREWLMFWLHVCVVFQRLLHLGSFPACWRLANVTPIPKGLLPSSVSNFWPISITPVLSEVFERLVVVCLGRFMEHWCVSNHPVCLSERFGFLWCAFVCVTLLIYTAECIGEWAGGQDCADQLQRCFW